MDTLMTIVTHPWFFPVLLAWICIVALTLTFLAGADLHDDDDKFTQPLRGVYRLPPGYDRFEAFPAPDNASHRDDKS